MSLALYSSLPKSLSVGLLVMIASRLKRHCSPWRVQAVSQVQVCGPVLYVRHVRCMYQMKSRCGWRSDGKDEREETRKSEEQAKRHAIKPDRPTLKTWKL